MKRIGLIFLIAIMFCIVIIAFIRKSGVSPTYYYSWNNSKQSTVSKWINSSAFLFNANYRPKEFMALSELNGEQLTNSTFNKALKNYECCEHILLKIFSKDTVSEALSYKMTDKAEYYERIRFLNSEFGSKTILIDGKDTLPCTFYLYERTYKLQPFISVNLIYEKKHKTRNKQMKLLIEPTLFNAQAVEITFNKDELSQIPQLKI